MNELRLRPYKNCDAQYIVSWIKDEETFRKWSADRINVYPITAEALNNHYDGIKNEDNFFEMTAYDYSGVQGHMIMRFTDEQKEDLRFGFVIVNDAIRGKGYGKQMLQLAIKYSFEILKAKRISLGVFENNPNAYHCYKAVGFKDVKLEKPEFYEIQGEKWNCLELELSRQDYFNISI